MKLPRNGIDSLGYKLGTPDGWFGTKTTEAVLRFQGDHGLVQEGVVNPRTVI